MTVAQDFTIFSPLNDLVALIGTADSSGNVVDPSFSTDPAHARPWLKLVENTGSSAIDFQKGSSVISQGQVEILDKRRFGTDKTSGFLTYYLADATGDTQLLGCRCVLRSKNTRGTWEVVYDGVIGGITLDVGTFVTYALEIRDARERERKLRCFDFASSTCIFPRVGPVNGWGYPTRHNSVIGHLEPFADPVLPPVAGVKMIYRLDAVSNAGDTVLEEVLGRFEWDPADKSTTDFLAQITQAWGQLWQDYGAPAPDFDFIHNVGGIGLSLPGIRVEWSPDNVVWKGMTNPYWEPFGTPFGIASNAFYIDAISDKDPRQIVRSIQFNVHRGSLDGIVPANGAHVFVRVRSNRAPSSDVPLFVEENFGLFLKDIYDGYYSYGTVSPVRYDVAAMNAMIINTPMARGRIEAPVEDARTWVQENIYKVCGYAPAIKNGLVMPIKYEIPDASVPILTLDDSNIIKCTWSHTAENVVNEVVVEYQRDLVPSNISSGAVNMTPQKVVIQRDRINSQSRLGTKPLTFKPVTLRSVLPADAAGTAQISDDVGTLIGLKRAEEALRRFTFGAQTCTAEVMLDATTEAAQEGDWCLLGASWIPDYVSKQRGGNRLMQITKINRLDPGKRSFDLVDSGPYDTPAAQPQIASNVVNADRSITVSVVNITPGQRAEVQYGIEGSGGRPSAESGEWKTIDVLPHNVLSRDPFTSNAPDWSLSGAGIFTVADGAVGPWTVISDPGVYADAYSNTIIPIDLTKTYRVHARVRRSGDATGTLYIGVGVRDAAGNNIPGNGTFWYVGAVNSVPPGGTPLGPWTEYSGTVGVGSALGPFPPNAVDMYFISLLNYQSGVGAGTYQMQDAWVGEADARSTIATSPPNLPQGAGAWTRARGVQDGRRSSAWYNMVGPLTIPATPIMRDFAVSVLPNSAGADYGKPLVEWERTLSVGGLEILYRRYPKDGPVPAPYPDYTSWVAFYADPTAGGSSVATVGQTVLPIVLKQWENVAVEIMPYSGFAGGLPTGIIGPVTARKSAQRHDGTYQPPVVRVAPTETATVGALNLDIYDPGLSMAGVEVYTQVGNAAPSGWVPVTLTQVGPGEFTGAPTVSLAEGQPSYIGYRLTAYDAEGNLVNVAQDVMAFDQSDYPALVDVDMSVDPAIGATLMSWVGDSNTASVKIAFGTSGPISAAATRTSGLLVNGRTGSVGIGTYTPGQTVYVSVLAYSGPGATGLESTQLYQYQEARPVLTGTIPPGIQETATETAAGTVPMIGTLVVTVTDPQLRATGVRTRVQVGNTPWTAWSSLFAPGTGFTVSMVEGFTSKIEYEVYADLGSGSVLYWSGVVPFNSGDVPNLTGRITWNYATGKPTFTWNGDASTASIKAASSTATFPDATTTRAGTLFLGRNGSFEDVVVPVGSTYYLSVFAYSLASGLGTESATLYHFYSVRPDLSGTIPPGIRETATETAVGTVPMIGTLAITVTDPQLRVTGVRFRTQSGNAAWSSYSSFLLPPSAYQYVTMVEGHVSKIEYEVWADLGGGGVLYYTGVVPFSTGSIPMAPQLLASFDDNGSLRVLAVGDSDTASIKLGASTVSVSAAATAAAAATAVSARVVEYTNALLSIASGQLVYVVGYAFPLAAGGGTISAPGQVNLTREGAGSKTPTGTIIKTMRVHGTQFTPENVSNGPSASTALQVTSTGITFVNGTTSLSAEPADAYTVLPPGVTVTAMRVNWWAGSAFSGIPTKTVVVSLLDVAANGGGTTTLASVSDSAALGAGWRTATTTVSASVGTDPLIVKAVIAAGVALSYVEIEYTMPTYDKTI